MRAVISRSLIVLFFATTIVAAVNAQTAIQPSRLQTRFTDLTAPIYLTHAGDGSKRIFIVERTGVIKVVQPGSATPTVFLDISGLTTTSGERGLLSMAFHPDYRNNRRFFVYYARNTDGAIQISEFQASPMDPNVALTTEKPILTIPHPTYNNHYGGTIAFGPDGYLYAAPGDGGGSNDPNNNAQNINSLLGKMLRIDVNVATGYAIPPTNPFAGATPGADEIYALGLRNPFRWSFDRGGTRQLWAADVGQDAWEEVDIITQGGNYGWRVYEGFNCTGLDPNLCSSSFVAPLFVYSSQNTTQRCSITGGYVYRGGQNALPNGAYVYGDYCTGEIMLWHGGQQTVIHDIPDFNLYSFGEDEDGEIYVIHAGLGQIKKIVPVKANADFTGDGRTDLGVFRPSDNTWYIRDIATGAFSSRQFGASGDIPVPEDYDGDRKTDIAVFRPSTGTWYYAKSSDGSFNVAQFGQSGDIPAAGDYDGDSKADLVVFRPASGTWHGIKSSDSSTWIAYWGASGDIPVQGDYDGDGKYDVAVWRPSNGTWYIVYSSNGRMRIGAYGEPGDIPTPGDFDGDGRNDLVVFRPSNGTWYQRRANDIFAQGVWGEAGDQPAVGDYDGDGVDDMAIFRPADGYWYVVGSSSGVVRYGQWGIAGDVPLPAKDYP